MGERGLGRKGGKKDREIIRQHEGRSWQRGKEAPHLACALGPATWGSGPAPSFSSRMPLGMEQGKRKNLVSL